jgi:PAS domain S-box-containing protein
MDVLDRLCRRHFLRGWLLAALSLKVLAQQAVPPPEPLVAIQDLVADGRTWGEKTPVRVQGVVTAILRDGSFFVQQGASGVRVLGGTPDGLQPGSQVEVRGTVSLQFQLPVVKLVSATPMGTADEPIAPLITAAEAMETTHAMTLVRMRARLEDTTTLEGWEWVLRPKDSDLRLIVDLGPNARNETLARIEPQSLVEVTGVLSRRINPQGEVAGIHLAVRWASDVELIDGPLFWTPVRVWQAFGLATLLVGGLAIWRLTLRHEVIRRTQSLQARLDKQSALKESEERFSRIFGASPDPIVISRAIDGSILDANPAFGSMTGYAREDILGKTTLDLNLWRDVEARARALADIRSKGSISNVPFELRSCDGRWRHCLVSAERIELNGEGCVLAIIRDVTDRERQARALVRAQNIGQIGTWSYDLQLRRFDATEEARRICGASSTSITMEDLVALIHPEDVPRVREDWARMLAGGTHDIEYRLLVQGEVRWTHVRAEAECDDQGRPRWVAGVTQDITARKQIELALRRSEDALRRAQMIARVGHWEYEVATDCFQGSDVTAALCELTHRKYTSRELLAQVVPEESQRITRAWKAALKGRLYNVDYRIQLAGGRTRWLHVQGEPEFDAAGRLVRIIGAAQDITEQKNAQTQLEKREALFRAIADQTPDSLFLLDIADPEVPARIVYANAAAGFMHGRPAEELVGLSITALDDPETATHCRGRIDQLNRGELVSFRGGHIRQDGSRFPVDVTAKLIPVVGPGMVLSIDRDITEQLRAESLSEGQRRVLEMIAQGRPVHETLETLMRLLEDHSPEMICSVLLMGADGEHLDHAAGPSLPTSYSSVVDGIRIGPSVGSCGTAAFRGEPVLVADIESDPLWADFKQIALAHGLRACWSTPILDRDGRVQGTFALYFRSPGLPTERHQRLIRLATQTIAICLTRHKSERALRDSQERYEALVSSVDGVVWEADPETAQFLFVSSAAQRLLGYPVEEWLQPGFWIKHMHPDDREAAISFCRIESLAGRSHVFDYRMIAADGRILHIRDYVTVLMESGKPRLLRGILVDITAQKQIEEQKRRLETDLHHAQRLESIGTLAGGIAHDFNNIIGAILGNAELALKDVPADHPASESLDEINKAGLRARHLVQMILAFGRGDRVEKRPLPIQPVVEEAVHLLRPSLPKGVRIVTRIDPTGGPVLTDASQIHQIVMNLGTNACQAMEDRTGTIHISLDPVSLDLAEASRIPGLSPGNHLLLAVRDEGIGMDAATLGRIFDPFFTTKGVGKGTGLGLPVVHGIVTGHQGAIRVTSKPNQGACFEVFLPITPELPEATPAPAMPLPRLSGAGRHILMLDDEEALVRYQSRLLEREGFKVTGFTSPARALEYLRQAPEAVDGLITDLNLPGASGIEVIQEARRLRPGLPVILMSGLISEDLKEAARDQGAGEFLAKPGNAEGLMAALQRVLGNSTPAKRDLL